ncbi:MAG: gliding motility-associated C-terminal domain-containing protein [Flavobacteriales bacterium]|nr:gliding motility-associated C-terminal domain-containing protein [Flavobacteriales bacterium]
MQLDEGESYQVQSGLGEEDLTGTTVKGTPQSGSCRPFALFSGAVCTYIPLDCAACDHIYEQNLPVPYWGLSYYSVPWQDSNGYTYRVLADQDGTSVTVDNGAPISLNAGQFVEVNNSAEPHCFSGNLPFSVSQFMQGSNCAGGFSDPALLILNAEEQEIDDITFATVVSGNITAQYINVVIDANDNTSVVLDGSSVPPSQFEPFPSCTDKVFGRLPLTQGSHRISCVNGLVGYVYGTGPNYETYAYSVGSFRTIPTLAFDTAFCILDTTDFITLSSSEQIFNPVWTTQSNPLDTLFEGLSYTFQPSASDVYILSGSSNLSDCLTQFFFSVELVEPPETNIAPLTSVCAYTPLLIDLELDPNGTFNYDWNPDAGLSNDNVQDPILIPSHSGWYHVDVTSLSGCSATEDSVFVTVTDGDVLGVQATGEPEVICVGGQSQLNVAVRQIIGEDDFDGGIGPLWELVQGGASNNLCGAVNGNALRFNDAGPRVARTIPLDVSAGGSLRFALKLANGVAPCDDVDPGENILVEYSINGSSWTIMANYSDAQFPDFGTVVLDIPAGGQSPNTQFRWRQLLNSGLGQDNWVLDDVAIAADDISGINFSWTPGLSLDNPTIADPLSTPGATQMFTVQMTDTQTGCPYVDSVEVVVAPIFSLDLTNDTALCGNNISVQLDADPVENGSYTWQWTPNDGSLSATTLQSPFASPTETTTYIVTVSNQIGCSRSDTVTVVVVEALVATTFATPDSICQGQTTQLQVQAFQGSGNYLYAWTPPGSLNDASISTPIGTPQSSVVYTVTVSDAQCGGSVTVPVSVFVTSAPPIELGPDQFLCPGGSLVLAPGTAQAFEWSTLETTNSIVVDESGTYWVRALNGDCIATDTVDILAAPSPGELATTVYGCEGRSAALFIPVSNGTYLWAAGDTTQSISVSVVGDYPFTVIDTYGCSYSDIAQLIVDPLGAGLVVPNVISPNGDGLNEQFEPQSGGNPEVAVTIFNRFGKEVFNSPTLNTLWNGRDNGGAVSDGTYFYVVRYRAACANQVEEQKGTVTVVR